MLIHLSRVVCALQVRTPLIFAETDGGFKGSGWHGRIDNFIQRDDVLRQALKKATGSSASDRYWIDAPEDRVDDASGPFRNIAYEIGHRFEVAMVLAVNPERINRLLLSPIVSALTKAGQADGAAFKGSFDLLSTRVEAYPMISLAPAPSIVGARSPSRPAAESAILTVELLTMLRLGDGEHMEAAQRALAQSMQAVPSLGALAASVLRRVTTLGIFENEHLLSGLAELVNKLASHSEIRVHHARVAPYDGKRISGHVNERLPIGGLLGAASFVGPSALMAELYPLFKLAEWIRVGQKTGLGLGRIRVAIEPLPSPLTLEI